MNWWKCSKKGKNNMGTVIGPFSTDEFRNMNIFRGNIDFYKRTDRTRYADALVLETKALRKILDPRLKDAA